MTKTFHCENELNALSKLFLDFHLKTTTSLVASEITRKVHGSCESKLMNTMQHFSDAMAEQNITRLLMVAHKTDKFYLFGCLKRNKYKVLTLLLKRKHKNTTISEFIKGICNFQHFEINNILFLFLEDWMKR